jgi:hypothetical protein
MESETEFEVLQARWRVVERRDGAIYKTEYIDKVWVSMELRGKCDPNDRDIVYRSISNSDPDWKTLPRRKKN